MSKSKEPTMTDTAPLPAPEVPAAIAPEAAPSTAPPRAPTVPTGDAAPSTTATITCDDLVVETWL